MGTPDQTRTSLVGIDRFVKPFTSYAGCFGFAAHPKRSVENDRTPRKAFWLRFESSVACVQLCCDQGRLGALFSPL